MKTNWNKTLIALGISALASLASAADQNDQNLNSPPVASERDSAPMSAQNFVEMAATTDMKEIHAGELALQKSDNADVKSFAKKLVSDHKKADKKLRAIAEKKNLNFPDTNSLAMRMSGHGRTNNWHHNSNGNENAADMNSEGLITGGPDHHILKGAELLQYKTQMKTNDVEAGERPVMLETLAGQEFDRAFAAKMVKGHEQAIRKFETAADNLTDADLKKYAEKTLPTLRKHLKMAQELASKAGTWPDSGMANSMPDQN